MSMRIGDLHCHRPMHLLGEDTKVDPGLKSMIKVKRKTTPVEPVC